MSLKRDRGSFRSDNCRMPDKSTALRHAAWADEKLFHSLSTLPIRALAATYGPPEWTVAHMARHIVDGAEWFRYCLSGVSWSELRLPEDVADLQSLSGHLASVNAALIEQAGLPEELVSFTDETGPKHVYRSVILAQAALHATEHRAQIACALEVSGFAGLSLDAIDVWSFASSESRDGR